MVSMILNFFNFSMIAGVLIFMAPEFAFGKDWTRSQLNKFLKEEDRARLFLNSAIKRVRGMGPVAGEPISPTIEEIVSHLEVQRLTSDSFSAISQIKVSKEDHNYLTNVTEALKEVLEGHDGSITAMNAFSIPPKPGQENGELVGVVFYLSRGGPTFEFYSNLSSLNGVQADLKTGARVEPCTRMEAKTADI